MNRTCDVVIVGTGAAGLFCALNLPDRMKIRMITKETVEESDSFLAQGGICVLRGEEDYKDYFLDTMRAGHFENNEKMVELMLRSSNNVVRNLMHLGVQFDRTPDGNLAYTREGGHSKPRILFHEDVTGREITATLLQRAREKDNIIMEEHTTMVDIVVRDDVCVGIVVVDAEGKLSCIQAPNVVLACGGLGGLFKNSTNMTHITGDALAIAIKHNVAVEYVDYIQVHPTTLYSKKPGRRFLISESVRGEGALLYNKDGERFTDELQPRDLLTEAIWEQMKKDGTEFVWEDMRPIGKEEILQHFPNIYQRCVDEGYDPLTAPIPVVPAQHYFMGGIKVDPASRTSMSGLYAVGETSCTGVHGRNRLASNSLLESLVFSQRAADDISFKREPGVVCDLDAVDLSEYEDLDAVFESYRKCLEHKVEGMRWGHE